MTLTSEDDTFRALRKPDLQQMTRLWEKFASSISAHEYVHVTWAARREIFFEGHGWSWNEFFDKRNDYLIRFN